MNYAHLKLSQEDTFAGLDNSFWSSRESNKQIIGELEDFLETWTYAKSLKSKLKSVVGRFGTIMLTWNFEEWEAKNYTSISTQLTSKWFRVILHGTCDDRGKSHTTVEYRESQGSSSIEIDAKTFESHILSWLCQCYQRLDTLSKERAEAYSVEKY